MTAEERDRLKLLIDRRRRELVSDDETLLGLVEGSRYTLHGTENAYRKFKCRCEHCRAAANDARKKRRLAKIEATRAYEREWSRRRRLKKMEDAA